MHFALKLSEPKDAIRKSPEELRLLREAGISKAYLGVKSGDGKVLHDTCKGVDAAQMERTGKSLVDAGIELCAIILIGLAGKERSLENARATAEIINRIEPAELSGMNHMGAFNSDEKEYMQEVDQAYEIVEEAAQRCPDQRNAALEMADKFAKRLADSSTFAAFALTGLLCM